VRPRRVGLMAEFLTGFAVTMVFGLLLIAWLESR
jgi:tetrahydromethanopterin S-methyltransferase subunit F